MGRRHILCILCLPEYYGRSVGQGIRQVWQKTGAHLRTDQHYDLLHHMGHVNESYHGYYDKSDYGWW